MPPEELDFQRQFDESVLSLRDIDFMRLDPEFLADLLDIKPDFIVENNKCN